MMIGIIEDDRLLNQALNKMLTDKGYDTTFPRGSTGAVC